MKLAAAIAAVACALALPACESAPQTVAPQVTTQVAAAAVDTRAAKVEFRLSGRVTNVSDGDTLTLTGASGATIIRMSDMDTPEVSHGPSQPGQRFGRAAEASLKSMAPIGAEARAECYERDQYKRAVCTVFMGSRNLNLEQIERGWGMLPDNPDWIRDPRSASAQARAKQQRVGVWQDPNPQTPASRRYRCWQLKQCAGAEP